MGRDVARLFPRSNRLLVEQLYCWAILLLGIVIVESMNPCRGRIYWLYSHLYLSDSGVGINDTYRYVTFKKFEVCK